MEGISFKAQIKVQWLIFSKERELNKCLGCLSAKQHALLAQDTYNVAANGSDTWFHDKFMNSYS